MYVLELCAVSMFYCSPPAARPAAPAAAPPAHLPAQNQWTKKQLSHCSTECLKDEFMEMRTWDHNGSYPFCTLCNKWSGNDHINSLKHKNRLLRLQLA